MKLKILFSLIVCLALMGCQKQIVRDLSVYSADLSFYEKASMDASYKLEQFISLHCTCTEGTEGAFITPQCKQAANTVLIIKYRLPWHISMSRYNAGLSSVRPSKVPPSVPMESALCP